MNKKCSIIGIFFIMPVSVNAWVGFINPLKSWHDQSVAYQQKMCQTLIELQKKYNKKVLEEEYPVVPKNQNPAPPLDESLMINTARKEAIGNRNKVDLIDNTISYAENIEQYNDLIKLRMHDTGPLIHPAVLSNYPAWQRVNMIGILESKLRNRHVFANNNLFNYWYALPHLKYYVLAGFFSIIAYRGFKTTKQKCVLAGFRCGIGLFFLDLAIFFALVKVSRLQDRIIKQFSDQDAGGNLVGLTDQDLIRDFIII